MRRNPTINDIARLAGVSRATAARVFSGQDDLVAQATRERVRKVAAEIGYERNTIASSLRSQRTFMVALCIPDITNPFWPEVARGVQDTTEVHGYTTVTVNSDWNTERESNYLRMVRRNRFDGLIINPMGADEATLQKLDIPIVLLGSSTRLPTFDSVGSDTEIGAQAAFQHLWDLGHRRIGLIGGRSQRRKVFARYDSYCAFHKQHGLPLEDSLVIESEFSDEAGYAAMTKLLSLSKPPTAVFAANDVLAIGALKAAQAMQWHVPNDVSIVGMDDIYAATMTSPSLTTVAKPKYAIGLTAAQILIERLLGSEVATVQHIKLPCQLIQRMSTRSIV